MKSKKTVFLIAFLVFTLLAVMLFISYNISSENIFGQTEKLIAEFENEFSYSENLMPRWEKTLYKLDGVIETAKFLAQGRISKGYESLERIIKDLEYQEESEMIFEETYEALGWLGRFDVRAVRLLVSEFNPKADPVRAMNVLVGIKLTGNSQVLFECIKKIRPFMSEGEINARLQEY